MKFKLIFSIIISLTFFPLTKSFILANNSSYSTVEEDTQEEEKKDDDVVQEPGTGIDPVTDPAEPSTGTGNSSDDEESDDQDDNDDHDSPSSNLGLIVIRKLFDADGNLNTTNDRTPTEGAIFNVKNVVTNDITSLKTNPNGYTVATKFHEGKYNIKEEALDSHITLWLGCQGSNFPGATSNGSINNVSLRSGTKVECLFIDTKVNSVDTFTETTLNNSEEPEESTETTQKKNEMKVMGITYPNNPPKQGFISKIFQSKWSGPLAISLFVTFSLALALNKDLISFKKHSRKEKIVSIR